MKKAITIIVLGSNEPRENSHSGMVSGSSWFQPIRETDRPQTRVPNGTAIRTQSREQTAQTSVSNDQSEFSRKPGSHRFEASLSRILSLSFSLSGYLLNTHTHTHIHTWRVLRKEKITHRKESTRI